MILLLSACFLPFEGGEEKPGPDSAGPEADSDPVVEDTAPEDTAPEDTGEVDPVETGDPCSETVYYVDDDGDGYGDPARTESLCEPAEGYADNGADCDDARAEAHPGAEELDNDADDDCDEEVDEGIVPFSFELNWTADSVIVTIVSGSGAYDFGMAETQAGASGWFGETCIPGAEPRGYDDYGFDVCHTVHDGDTEIVSTADYTLVDDGVTLFSKGISAHVTYYLASSTECWTWGEDPTYYADFGCETP